MAINNAADFYAQVSSAGDRLVVFNFTSAWCSACELIGPYYAALRTKYPSVTFLEVDSLKCKAVAAEEGVLVWPTFIFYRNGVKIDRLQVANISLVEAKVQRLIGGGNSGDSAATDGEEKYGQGFIELNNYIVGRECECLNESNAHPMVNCLSTLNDGHLQSDCDEQLILSVTFNQKVKVHSLQFKAPVDMGPKHIKLFVNQPRTIDFDMAESMPSVQDFTLDPKDVELGRLINLRFVKFQSVQNLQIYVQDNQGGGEVTQIDYIGFIGKPVLTTRMADFKRVTVNAGGAQAAK